MFNWEGCPISLFDVYMEVGEVRKRKTDSENTVFVEIWVGSVFAREHVRPQCEKIRRCPVWGVLRQVVKISEEKKAGIIFLCDDVFSNGNDTENWSTALYLLLRELKNRDKLQSSILFTGKTPEDIRLRSESICNPGEKAKYDGLYEMLDVLVTGQPNPWCGSTSREIIAREENCLSELKRLLDDQPSIP